MTNDTMTDADRKALLKKLGLKANGMSLSEPAKLSPCDCGQCDNHPRGARPHLPTTGSESIPLAPEGVDPLTMKASDIVFDDRLLDDFPDLSGSNFAAASAHVFRLYSAGRNKERNGLLHRRITEFIGAVSRSRKTGGHVRDKIKTTKTQRENAQVLAAHDIDATDLTKVLAELAALRGELAALKGSN
jgi:hypothetical protein